VPRLGTAAIERQGCRERDRFERFDELEELSVGSLTIEVEGLVADRVSPTADQSMAIIIDDLFEWPPVDDRLVALEARALFALVGLDGERAELESLDSTPGLDGSIENSNTVKPDVFESGKKAFLGQCTGDATAPEVGIVLQCHGNGLIRHDVGDDRSTSPTENPKDLAEELLFLCIVDQIQNAVGDHDIDRVV
jgi:hypothetical protein